MEKLKSVKKLGVEGYKKELEKQRSPAYKSKRNARLNKTKVKRKLEALVREEIKLEVRLEQVKSERAKVFAKIQA